MTNRRFAHGSNYHDGEPCPIVAAGMDPSDGCLAEIRRRFDHAAERETGSWFGTLPESEAKRIFRDVLDDLRIGSALRTEALRIARRLEWLK